MVVVLILGGVLALVPMNFGNWGSRSRLESAGNSTVAACTSARHQAIFDGYDSFLELGKWRSEGKTVYGHRFKYTNIKEVKSSGDEELDREAREEQQGREREWQFSEWHEMPEGCEITGVSRSKGQWEKLVEDRPYSIKFDPAGNVDNAVAIRIENKDMEVRREYRTVTVTVNALTSQATWQMGEQDLIQKRPASDFGQ